MVSEYLAVKAVETFSYLAETFLPQVSEYLAVKAVETWSLKRVV